MKYLLSNHSIARRLQLGVGLSAGLVFGLTVWFDYRVSREELERQTDAKAVTEIRAAARRLDDFITRIGMLPRAIAVRQQAFGGDPDPGIVPYLRQLLQQTPVEEVYGLYIAYEHVDATHGGGCLAMHRKNWPELTPIDYDYHDPQQEWYNGPKRSHGFYVTEPYFDEGAGNISMVSLTVPVFDKATNFIAVAGADLALDRIRELVRAARPINAGSAGTNGFAFLVSRAGKVIAHPNADLMLRRGFPGADLTSRPGGELVAGKPEGMASVNSEGERWRLYWATSPLSGWRIVLSIPEDEILIPVRQLTLRSGLVGLAGLVVLVLLVTGIARRFARPLVGLAHTAGAIEQGQFREEMLGDLPEHRDEMGELARSFRKMAREIQTREQSLAELNQNLERTVEQRTAELTARAGELEKLTRQSQERVALESSLGILSTSLRGNLGVAQVAEKALAVAIEFLGAPAGAMFVAGPDGSFTRLASHAYPENPDAAKAFAPGWGTVGQAALSRLPICAEPDASRLHVHFGFGPVTPSQVLAWPLVVNDTTVGVLELCLFKPLTDTQKQWLEKGADTMANALRFALESEERQNAEERVNAYFTSSSDGLLILATDRRFIHANEAAVSLFGFKGMPELLKCGPAELSPDVQPDGERSSQAVQERITKALQTGTPLRFDWVHQRQDGSEFPSEITLIRIALRGKPALLTIIRDITERKRNEQALAASERRVRRILETCTEGFCWVDSQGVLVEVNDAMCQVLARARDQVIGRRIYDFTDEENTRIFKENIARRAKGESGSYEVTLLRPDKTPVPCRVNASPLVDEHDVKQGSFGMFTDISDEKHAQAELKAAMQKAEEATEMKSMFLANMSHEIRTPMNAIIGLSHLALKTPLNPKQRDYVSKVHNAGTSLLAIINDILDFSKIEAGKLDLETTEFKLDEVIGSVTTLTAQRAHEKGLEFLTHLSPDIPESLMGDPLRLGQVLTNFVNNAVKFTERGEIRLNGEMLERTGDKVQLKFSVRDTGIGMSREQSARLFQPFTQADMSTTRKHGGTGLGLTICRRLVELMGGRIWLESEPGVGSTFYFTVWLGVGTQKGSGKTIPERLTKLRILVVDDNPAAREILQEPLSTIVSRVDTAASGKEALAAIKRQDPEAPYDLVFLDWRMPDLDGLQVSRHIKSDETLRHQPAIVLVTAFGREEVREEAERLHLDGFLLKPVTRSMIVDTLVSIFAVGEERGHGHEQKLIDQVGQLLGARILVVEDNEVNQQIAIELLQAAGASVTTANNGREAVDMLWAGPHPPAFDLVLMDLQMPEMDGYQATSKLRSDPRFQNLPILAMTAHATVEERQRCLSAGLNDHISKPIDPAMLYDTLRRFFRPRVGRSGSLPAEKPLPPGHLENLEPQASNPDLPALEGLNASDGLSRVAGNRKLYLRLLRQFVEQQAAVVDRISRAVAQSDMALAERLAHTLKGVAGNLGASPVQLAAGALEKKIRDRNSSAELESGFQGLSTALDPLLDRLQKYLGSNRAAPGPQPTTPNPQPPAKVRAAAAQLEKLLADFDPTALEFTEANHELLRPLFLSGDRKEGQSRPAESSSENWGQFQKLVQDYAFSEALAQLESALGRFPLV